LASPGLVNYAIKPVISALGFSEYEWRTPFRVVCVREIPSGSYWLPAPAVVVLADYAFAITCHPRYAVVAVTAELAGLVAVPPVG
jgi:hypothetical protein